MTKEELNREIATKLLEYDIDHNYVQNQYGHFKCYKCDAFKEVGGQCDVINYLNHGWWQVVGWLRDNGFWVKETHAPSDRYDAPNTLELWADENTQICRMESNDDGDEQARYEAMKQAWPEIERRLSND